MKKNSDSSKELGLDALLALLAWVGAILLARQGFSEDAVVQNQPYFLMTFAILWFRRFLTRMLDRKRRGTKNNRKAPDEQAPKAPIGKKGREEGPEH